MSKRNPDVRISREGKVYYKGKMVGFVHKFTERLSEYMFERWQWARPAESFSGTFSRRNAAANALLLAAGVMEEADPKGVQKDGEA